MVRAEVVGAEVGAATEVGAAAEVGEVQLQEEES